MQCVIKYLLISILYILSLFCDTCCANSIVSRPLSNGPSSLVSRIAESNSAISPQLKNGTLSSNRRKDARTKYKKYARTRLKPKEISKNIFFNLSNTKNSKLRASNLPKTDDRNIALRNKLFFTKYTNRNLLVVPPSLLNTTTTTSNRTILYNTTSKENLEINKSKDLVKPKELGLLSDTSKKDLNIPIDFNKFSNIITDHSAKQVKKLRKNTVSDSKYTGQSAKQVKNLRINSTADNDASSDSSKRDVHLRESSYSWKDDVADTSIPPAEGAAGDFHYHTIVEPKVLHSRTKRDLSSTRVKDGGHHEHHISLLLTIEGEDVHVDLYLNRDLLSNNYFEKHLKNGSHTIKKPKPHEANMCHYQGFIKERPESWAALSTCNGFKGIVFDGLELHYLEPIPGKSPSLSSPHYLLNHKHLRKKNNTQCGYKSKRDPALDLFQDKEFEKLLRTKRDTSSSGTIRGPFNSNELSRYVELILVADTAEYEKHDRDEDKIYQRCKDIANIVNALYQPLNIFIALVGVEIWKDTDPVDISADGDKTLTNFLSYRKSRLIPEHPNDNAQLLTGKMFDSGVVGKALKGPICTYQYSGGVNMDHSDSVGLVATTVAHEMGHNFGMEHDTDEDCKCPDKRCIMAPSSGTRSPSHWSSCSHEYLAISFERSMDYCLRNKPTSLFDSPVCGNGFVEPGEQCDCGLPQHCENSCCNASTCMLFPNATCATGHCCDLNTCRPKEAGFECRSALHECDLPEFCSGDSEYCPNNFYKEDGQMCLAGKAYCYEGMCRTHEHQCRLLWGPTGKNSHDKCYNLNREGNTNGNCGYNWANKNYKRCNSEDIKCGMMHCKHFNERLEFGMESVSKVSHRFISDKNQNTVIPCRVAQVDLGLDMVDPGLAPDGAKCGYKKMCVDQHCMKVSSLRLHTCECHSKGMCNNMGRCHCNVGYAFPECIYPGLGGSLDSGPASNPASKTKIVFGLFMFFMGIFVAIMIILGLLYYNRSNVKLWWLRKGRPATSRISKKDVGGKPGTRRPTIEDLAIKSETGVLSPTPPSSHGSKTNSPLLNGHLNGNLPVAKKAALFGKYEGFTLSPIKDKPKGEFVASANNNHLQEKKEVGRTSSIKVDISEPRLETSTNPAVATRKAPSLPPSSSFSPFKVRKGRPLSVPDASSVIPEGTVIPNSESTLSDGATSKNHHSKGGSTVARIASFLNKKDKGTEISLDSLSQSSSHSSNTLPRKATKINRKSLLQLEISHPMQLQATELPDNLVPVRPAPQPPKTESETKNSPEKSSVPKVSFAPSCESDSKKVGREDPSELIRIGSVRAQPVTTRPNIPKFGSMRAPRPKSLPPARPSQPPPRPPLPMIPGTPESEKGNDGKGQDSQSPDHIYDAIDGGEEEVSPKQDKKEKKSIFSMLYAKTKKKKTEETSTEPLYCNIDSLEVSKNNSSDGTPETPPSVMNQSSNRNSAEGNGLLSEIVSELANREPQYVNTLDKKKSKILSLVEAKPPPPIKLKSKENQMSPSKSMPTYSNVKPRGVFSFFKAATEEEITVKFEMPNSSSEASKSSIEATTKNKSFKNPSKSVDEPDINKKPAKTNFTSKSFEEPEISKSKTPVSKSFDLSPKKETKSTSKSLADSLASVKALSREMTKKAVNNSSTTTTKEQPSKESSKTATSSAVQRPAFPPDKIVFPPDKSIVSSSITEKKSVPVKKATTPTEGGKNKILTRPTSLLSSSITSKKTEPSGKKVGTSVSASKSIPGKLSDRSASGTKPAISTNKKNLTSKVDSGNRGKGGSINTSSNKATAPISTSNNKTTAPINNSSNKATASINTSSNKATAPSGIKDPPTKNKKTPPASTSVSSKSGVFAMAAKSGPKGTSHVASMQQKFEKENQKDSKPDKKINGSK